MGVFFVNAAYARQRSTQPTNASDASAGLFPAPSKSDYYSMGHGISKVTMLPKDYGYLDTGIRLLNEKLVIGSRMKYFGKSKRALYSVGDNKPLHDPKFDGEMSENKKYQKYVRWTEVIEKQPLIFDFYISYEPIEDLIIKAELQNAFDKEYIDPLDSNNDAAKW